MALQSTAAASVWIKADANGKAYYWRSDTREVRWDRPPPARKMAMSPLCLAGLSNLWASPIAGSDHQEPLSAPPRSTGMLVPPPPRLPYLSSHLARLSATPRPQGTPRPDPRPLASDEGVGDNVTIAAAVAVGTAAQSSLQRAAGNSHTAAEKHVAKQAMLDRVRPAWPQAATVCIRGSIPVQSRPAAPCSRPAALCARRSASAVGAASRWQRSCSGEGRRLGPLSPLVTPCYPPLAEALARGWPLASVA